MIFNTGSRNANANSNDNDNTYQIEQAVGFCGLRVAASSSSSISIPIPFSASCVTTPFRHQQQQQLTWPTTYGHNMAGNIRSSDFCVASFISRLAVVECARFFFDHAQNDYVVKSVALVQVKLRKCPISYIFYKLRSS